MKMIQLAIRSIRASLGRLILTTIAIVVGVGFVVGAFVLSDSLDEEVNSALERANSGVDGQIAVAELEFGDDTRAIPDTLIAEVEALPEVGVVTPTINTKIPVQ